MTILYSLNTVSRVDLRVPQYGPSTGWRHVRADSAQPFRIRALERRKQCIRRLSCAQRHRRGERSGDSHLERQPRASRVPSVVRLSPAASAHVSAALPNRLHIQVCFGQHARFLCVPIVSSLLYLSVLYYFYVFVISADTNVNYACIL